MSDIRLAELCAFPSPKTRILSAIEIFRQLDGADVPRVYKPGAGRSDYPRPGTEYFR